MPTVLVPLAQGCEELEAVTIINVLRRAGSDVCSASLDGLPVQGARGMVLQADCALDAVKARPFDLVALPGGQPGSSNLLKDPRILDLLQRHAAAGAYLAALCAAPTVLAAAGLLRGKRATSYPGALNADPGGAQLVDAPLVIDGRIITGRSAGTAMDFALALAELLQGKAARDEAETRLQRR